MHHLHDLPDSGTREARRSPGASAPIWLRGSDRVELWLESPEHAPAELSLVVIDATPRAGDRVAAEAPLAARYELAATPGLPPAPAVLTRSQWGADEGLRDGGPRYDRTIQQVHVHHTDTGNDYARDDVPGIIRAIYRYHVQSLGWSDIGYNFLVDRFGRIWEGRYGGITRPVRGAHTLGFNATSTGCSIIGEYQDHAPSDLVVPAIVELAAWKLGLYGRRADGTAKVTSEGSDKFRSGRVVVLPTIDGHRDTNDTECPGTLLYDHLPGIRSHTQARLDAYASTGQTITVQTPFALGGTPVAGRTLTVASGSFTPADCTLGYAWFRDGAAVEGAVAATYKLGVADAGAVISVIVTLHHEGYDDTTVPLASPAPVLIASRVGVSCSAASGTVVVTAKVVAKGTHEAAGIVVIVVGTTRQRVSVTSGTATATFSSVPAGTVPVSAAYLGDQQLLPAVVATALTT